MKTKTTLLPEKCSDKDEFEGQSHQKIADSLYQLIEESDTHSYCIGLEGEWGSGKTTIIKFLEKKTEKNPKIKTVYFDSWAHQGDPLRISFLSKIISRIYPQGKDRHLMLDKVRGNTSETHNVLNWNTIFIILIIFLGSLLMQHTDWFIEHISLDELKYKLTIFWLWGGLIVGLVLLFVYSFIKKGNWSIWDTTRYEVTFSKDKDSFEFEQLYCEIMEYYFGKVNAEDRKLLIVFDNLDRLPHHMQEEVWAALQVFMDCNNKYKNKVWVIIPYAPDKLYRGNEVFMEKCFQLRIDVPRARLASWTKFFKEQWIIAAGKTNNLECEEAMAIFRSLAVRGDGNNILKGKNWEVNPRMIKDFINQVIFYRRLFPNYSMKTIAYYIYQRFVKHCSLDQIKEDFINLGMDKDFDLLDLNERAELAGILFGSDKEAQDDLYNFRVMESFFIKDEEKFVQLVSSTAESNRVLWEEFINVLQISQECLGKSCYLFYQLKQRINIFTVQVLEGKIRQCLTNNKKIDYYIDKLDVKNKIIRESFVQFLKEFYPAYEEEMFIALNKYIIKHPKNLYNNGESIWLDQESANYVYLLDAFKQITKRVDNNRQVQEWLDLHRPYL